MRTWLRHRKFFSIQRRDDLKTLLRALGAAPLGSAGGKLASLKSLKARRGPPAARDRGNVMALQWRVSVQKNAADVSGGEALPEPVLEVVGFVRGEGLTCK